MPMGTVYRIFKDQNYPIFLVGLPIDEEELDLFAYENIKRSHIHDIVSMPTILP